VAALLGAVSVPAARAAPTVAIFSDPGFPYFSAPYLSGPDVQAWFARLGVTADLLSAGDLADPRVFRIGRYGVLIHLYGNTFPEAAAGNLRRFRQYGGGIVSAGVPFCHPCRQTGAAGWQWVASAGDAAEVTAEAAHSGSCGAKLAKGGPGWSGLVQQTRIPAVAGETFTLGGWAKTRDTSGGPQADALLLRSFDAGGNFLGQAGPDLPPPGGDWTFVSAQVTTPPGTAEVDTIVALWKPPATVWLDDLALVRGELTPAATNLLPNASFEQLGGEWKDLGHTPYFGHDQMGTGGFYGSGDMGTDLVYHAGADPMKLAVLGWSRWGQVYPSGATARTQALDPRTLPPGDEVTPIVEVSDAAGAWPAVAVVRHRCAEFPGAIDVWAGVSLFSYGGGYLQEQLAQVELYGRGALYILHEKGALPGYAALLRRADAAYRASRPGRLSAPVGTRRSRDGVFPKSAAPARHIVAADVSRLPLDQQLALVSLEGVINGRQPRLYLITDRPGMVAKPTPQERWLEWLRERGDVAEVERVADPWSLTARWPNEIRGMIITDPDLPASVNVATMMCGLEGAIMASPTLAQRLKLPVVADLRGRWKTNVAAYEWAIADLWPKLNHDFVAMMWPGWVFPRDYIIAHQGFCFWITGVRDAVPGVGSPLQEAALMSRLLAKAPVNIGTIGAPWAGDLVGIQEAPGVGLLSEYGKFMVWSAETGNLSVHSGTRRRALRHEVPPPPALDRSKVYLSFMVSDGDAPINWCSFFLTNYWDDPARGTFPLAWSFGPTGLDLMPDVMDYYYRKAGPNDAFVCACSGVGYCYPEAYASRYDHPDRVFDGFLDLTRQYMERTDERGLWTHSAGEDTLRRYAAALPAAEYFLPDYGLQPDTTVANANSLVGGVPAFHAVCGFDPKGGPERARELLLADIRRFTPTTRPAFLNAFVQCYPVSPTLLKQVLDELGPEYVPVLPEHLAALYRQAQTPWASPQAPASTRPKTGDRPEWSALKPNARGVCCITSVAGALASAHNGL